MELLKKKRDKKKLLFEDSTADEEKNFIKNPILTNEGPNIK